MFENHNKLESSSTSERCKPDYERSAKRLKRVIDADSKCLEGMKKGISSGSVELNRDQATLYYAIIGSLTMNIPKRLEEYDKLLILIEENN